jgi:hypothetical protein
MAQNVGGSSQVNPLIAFAILGLLVNRAVDFLRNAFDKQDRIPKAYWLLAAWLLGIVLALIICNTHALVAYFHMNMTGTGCLNVVLAGLGFGSVAGFWHEFLSRLSGAPAPTPKGLAPRPKG